MAQEEGNNKLFLLAHKEIEEPSLGDLRIQIIRAFVHVLKSLFKLMILKLICH